MTDDEQMACDVFVYALAQLGAEPWAADDARAVLLLCTLVRQICADGRNPEELALQRLVCATQWLLAAPADPAVIDGWLTARTELLTLRLASL